MIGILIHLEIPLYNILKHIFQIPTMTAEAKRAAYENMLGDTAATFNSSNAQTFRPQAGMDVADGTLPPGEVDMSQIAGLMSKK